MEAPSTSRTPRSTLQRPEEFRLAVYLADVEGFAYKEIAEIMDTLIGTVVPAAPGPSPAARHAVGLRARQRPVLIGRDGGKS